MKNLLLTLITVIPLIAFSQPHFDLHVTNNSSYDVFVVVRQTTNCNSPYTTTGVQSNRVLNGGGTYHFFSTTEYMYEISICEGLTSSCGTCVYSIDVLGHKIPKYTGFINNCGNGDAMDVFWQTNASCEDIELTITDQ